ncbi:MAG: heavy-metal-associated domain-containing protein [Ruminococcaceae bacterium]|nr:heavy-metal-associated domain-containing protein [Oscillospiraceae bacterium]
MKTVYVPEMMCQNCVRRITEALTEAKLDFTVDLDTKTVSINGCENCLKTAISELDDLGFSAEVR